ncbi:MAG TPA: efflux RND transporter periplasmic adaptor subunit [Paracoccaceae bacterium]|nr:efflux RND transporter periplasmic adaptor subunit [Paracoccaceae bacterium]
MSVSIRKTLIGAVVLGAIGAAVFIATRPQPVPVDVATVERAPMEVTVNADALTRIRNLFEVSAPVSGTVQRSELTVGEIVARGQTVAIIEPSPPALMDVRSRTQAEAAVTEAEAALHLAQTNLNQAHVSLDFAQESHDRVRSLYDRGATTHDMLDAAELALAQQKAAVLAAEDQVELREVSLARAKAVLDVPEPINVENIEVIAPVDGRILDISESSERLVAAGTPLVKIGRLDDLELVADILSTDATRLKIGAAAYVERWGGDAVLGATLSRIEPSAFTKVSALGISEQRVRVTLDFDDLELAGEKLGDGFQAFVRIVEWRAEDVVQVPISALFRDGDQWSVFRLEDGVAVQTAVDLGHRNAQVGEILSGLEGGETVITHPSDRVADGVLVIDRNDL